MSYSIEPKTVKDFISMSTNLPRFQRKQTWKPKSNFKLCISIFKDYPIGVVIINKNDDKNWVLDGRQRLNALTKISNNPVEVYGWAKAFIGFKTTSDKDEIKNEYWKKIDEYLQKDFSEDVYNKDKVEEDDEEIDEDAESSGFDDDITRSFDPGEQKESLQVLLDLILMVHQIKNGKSRWERNFDFRDVVSQLRYYEVINGQTTFNPYTLIKSMNDAMDFAKVKNTKEVITKEEFIAWIMDSYLINEADERHEKLIKEIDQRWEDIHECFVTVYKVQKILEEARIGVIEIKQASNLDAQNMFSLVNSGGTQLTAEELLSAKPYWNVPVRGTSEDVKKNVKQLYDVLNVEPPEDVVRWDLCATLLSRIDKKGLVFNKSDTKENLSIETTLGFKLISALYMEGISSNHVADIEKNRNILNWETEFEPLVNDLNNLCDLIYDVDYFKCLESWKDSIMSLTSNTIALEFLTIMYKYWESIGKKVVECSEVRNLKRNSIILFDKLIYEYASKMWRGSSDSKLAKDIKVMEERFKPISEQQWIELLQDLSNGSIGDSVVTQNLVKPILYHEKCLKKEYPSKVSTSYDIDHIFPQALFSGNNQVNQKLKDSLINLEILSSENNIIKKDKKLNDINSADVINEICNSSGISKNEIEKYSSITNIEDLKKDRLKRIKDAFKNNRSSMMSN